MKKIHLLILKAFIRPFIVTFFIVMFVLLMLFLFKYIDDLIGKGFEWYVILELLAYQSAVQISMAMPLSMLLSSIMTFGNLGESYELVAIKAAGISLRKAMTPLFILVGLFSGGAFLFSDYILPVVNLKMGALLYDVRIKQADFLIKPGIFNNTIPGYSIRAKGKSKDGKILYDLMIYDHKSSNTASNVLLAKEGYIYNSPDNNTMILKLKDGVRYEDSRARNAKVYNPRQQFTRFYFDETEQKFDMSAFQMKRTDENLFKSHHMMLNLKQLRQYTDSNAVQMDSLRRTVFKEVQSYYYHFNDYYKAKDTLLSPSVPVVTYQHGFIEAIPNDKRTMAINSAMNQVRYIKDVLNIKANEDTFYRDKDIRYNIEFQRKFTLAVSCLLLFCIGAPLGAIIRKGGLGLPVVMAIIFFLIYHIISTVSEKSAKEGNIDTFWGMWMAIFTLSPLAVFLAYKAATDSALFDIEQYRLKAEKAITWIKNRFGARSRKVVQARKSLHDDYTLSS
ncbi:LptF/LptG family permease [Parapedobacter sp. ISTM3]|uniref:Lipopolysaccharide export system permease protein n=1 Tax=Parapedobacter luteus TaxID=623280 RepID=A0A1T5BMT4_9SPHI|nr:MULTISPECIES: LptF/LptG family permease [Parapedobacter]MBK1439392.1 LptF/LptG family permease [Parapedobacter sp. ISTM3]SKB48591.1 lipopolysaccharide export system permease protein [Parapedobacter luteus]